MSLKPQSQSSPVVLTASVVSRPQPMCLMAGRPVTTVGSRRSVVLPSPSWPRLLSPQVMHLTVGEQRHGVVGAGSDRRLAVVMPVTCTGVRPVGRRVRRRVGRTAPRPHAMTVPSDLQREAVVAAAGQSDDVGQAGDGDGDASAWQWWCRCRARRWRRRPRQRTVPSAQQRVAHVAAGDDVDDAGERPVTGHGAGCGLRGGSRRRAGPSS